ncbi:hypothetical protein [Comamonas sp. GB3 AK4-5]|uniref:hypothetical protein n=1 Tax=Comamonas sp. GB3 AK4-5 TaxID=3231487 RepID=UPI00351E55D1
MTKEEQLKNYLNSSGINIFEYSEKYKKQFHKVNKGFLLNSISNYYQYKGIQDFFISNNISSMKQNFYTSSLLSMKSREHGMNKSFCNENLPFNAFLYALLSDEEKLISSIANEDLVFKDSPNHYHYYFYALQLIIRGDYVGVEGLSKIKNQKSKISHNGVHVEINDFFRLFFEKNTTELSSHIESLTKIRFDDHLDDKFLAKWAVICCKLCWIKGLNVFIENDRIPMDLMPVLPIAKYNEVYDFLSPGWKPPLNSFFSKLFR